MKKKILILNVASVASVDLTIPTSSWDDEIGICSITRDLYFANYIANTTWYGMGDCKISAGLIIKNRSY